MINESLEIFIEEMGEPDKASPIPLEVIAQYEGKLPELLVEVWDTFGSSTFQNGLFRFTNPIDFEFTLDLWLQETPIYGQDNFLVFGCSAFGDLFFIGEKSHKVYSINSCLGVMEVGTYESSDSEFRSFLVIAEPEDFYLVDLDDDSLFDQALEKLGPLQSNEVYGFVPALCMGGGKRQLITFRRSR